MTHFACADGTGIDAQLARFEAAALPTGLPCSAANSAALLRYPHAHHQWVRPGIMLYGGSPMPDLQSAEQIGLRPVMTLVSRIIGVQNIQPGEAVGYSATFTADRPMRVGTVWPVAMPMAIHAMRRQARRFWSTVIAPAPWGGFQWTCWPVTSPILMPMWAAASPCGARACLLMMWPRPPVR